MNRATSGLLAAVLVLPLTVAGCTSSSAGKGGSSTPGAPAVSTPAGIASPSAPASSPAAESITQANAAAALLTPAEIGGGFTRAQFSPSKDPLPCTPNDPPLEDQVRSTVAAGTAVVNDAKEAGLSEELRAYADAGTASRVVAIAKKGLDCAHGKLNLAGTPEDVAFTAPQDVTSQLDADEALVVQATSREFSIVLIGARLGRLVVLFSFLRAKATKTSTLPNPLAVAAKGLAKIRNS